MHPSLPSLMSDIMEEIGNDVKSENQKKISHALSAPNGFFERLKDPDVTKGIF